MCPVPIASRNVMLQIDGVWGGYGDREVLQGISAGVIQGEFVGVLGPNGAGKTTLVKLISGLLLPSKGDVRLQGKGLGRYSARELARHVATVPQRTTLDFAFSVAELVSMGRYPHASFLGGETRHDREIVRRVMQRTGTAELADRPFNELSGGEQQRVILARALAQEPELLLLDEPTAHLDIAYQLELMELLRDINRAEGLVIIMVIHDLNLASLYADRLLLLKDGRIHSDGPPDAIMVPETIEEVFGSPVTVFPHPDTGRPQVMLKTGAEYMDNRTPAL